MLTLLKPRKGNGLMAYGYQCTLWATVYAERCEQRTCSCLNWIHASFEAQSFLFCIIRKHKEVSLERKGNVQWISNESSCSCVFMPHCSCVRACAFPCEECWQSVCSIISHILWLSGCESGSGPVPAGMDLLYVTWCWRRVPVRVWASTWLCQYMPLIKAQSITACMLTVSSC